MSVADPPVDWQNQREPPHGRKHRPDQKQAVKPAPFADETADVSIEKLKLVDTLDKAGITVNVTQLLTDGRFEDTTTGAPELTIDLLDRNYKLLKSRVLGDKPEVTLDGIPFRLTEVSLVDTEQLELLFEHKIVALLREHDSPLKANRATTTRAQFVERMLKEIADKITVKYVCPEINVVQPITASKQTGRTLTSKTLSTSAAKAPAARSGGGFSVSSLTIRTWDGGSATLGAQQLQNAAIILQVCQQLNAPAKAVLAIMEAASVEPDSPYNNPGTPGDHSSTGTFQLLPSTAAATGLNPLDLAACAAHWLTQGFYRFGGGIHQAQTMPGLSAGQIAQNVEGSAFPARYDQAGPGALTVINAFSGGGSLITGLGASSVGSSLTTITKQGVYEFSRGQGGQKEDSWTCMQRLAQEVNWRCFVAGRNSVYFVTDDDLLKSESKYKITPGHPGVSQLTFQAEIGKRTIVRKGKRIPKPSEAQLNARVRRWWAPPGTIIELEGYGVADDPWIVAGIQRPLFDRTAQVTLAAPQKPSPEPPNPTVTQTVSSGAGGGTAFAPTALAGTLRAKVVQVAQAAIQRQATQHAFHYGQVRPYPASLFGPAPIVTDCSGFSILCYKGAGAPDPNGTNFDGQGWTGSLIGRGQPVAAPQPADLVFYPGHVAVYMGNGQIANMGSEGEPVAESIRAPHGGAITGIRSYL